MRRNTFLSSLLPTLALTILGFAVMGYHPGLEDDGVYLAAVKFAVNPSLFPHDAPFFRLQMQATLFDQFIAHFVRWTGLSVACTELLWQFASLFLILWASAKIARHLFAQRSAQWAAVAMLAALFTLPVAGTALTIADQYLHPRNLATALILLAVSRILESHRWQALALLLLAFLLHPIMAAMGISFCAFLTLALLDPPRLRLLAQPRVLLAAVPLGWVFEPATPAWRQALVTRTYYFLYHWEWYEWLGAMAPILLFWILWRVARRHSDAPLAHFSLAVFAYALFQQIVAMVMLAPESPLRLAPLQPMRYLQLVYISLALAAGGLLGRYLLKAKVWRWALFLLLFNGGMFAAQRQLLPASNHLELPGLQTSNAWLQAFAWVRLNTPADAYFALDPHYLAAPGEDYHSFRALAERSQLSDAIKDTAVVTQVPSLAPLWQQQQLAQTGWSSFQLADFERLKAAFGVNWVLVSYPSPQGLACRWHNRALTICQIP